MDAVVAQVQHDPDVLTIDRTDGVKLFVKHGWVLMRPSGTEPLFRLFVEAADKPHAERFMTTYTQLVETILQRQ